MNSCNFLDFQRRKRKKFPTKCLDFVQGRRPIELLSRATSLLSLLSLWSFDRGGERGPTSGGLGQDQRSKMHEAEPRQPRHVHDDVHDVHGESAESKQDSSCGRESRLALGLCALAADHDHRRAPRPRGTRLPRQGEASRQLLGKGPRGYIQQAGMRHVRKQHVHTYMRIVSVSYRITI